LGAVAAAATASSLKSAGASSSSDADAPDEEGLVGFKRPGLVPNVPDAALLARLVELDVLDAQ